MDWLLEFFRSNFYIIDLTVAISAPVLTYALYRAGKIDRYFWGLFWLGAAIGLTWEVPMQLVNEFSRSPVHFYTRPPPVPFYIIIVAHSLWDGGLFLLGVGVVRLACGGPVFRRFRFRELLVLILWGQASELWVELTSTLGEAWAYVERPWNPKLFTFNGQPITLMPQLIWLAAPVVFYLAAVALRRRQPADSR